MASLKETLSLTKINYKAIPTIGRDKETGKWIGIIDNNDLGVVLVCDTEEELKKQLDQAVNMHCYMSTVDSIHIAINLLKVSPYEKPSVNVLVPVAA